MRNKSDLLNIKLCYPVESIFYNYISNMQDIKDFNYIHKQIVNDVRLGKIKNEIVLSELFRMENNYIRVNK